MFAQNQNRSISRRDWLRWSALVLGSGALGTPAFAQSTRPSRELRITDIKITPVALPDPPILAASGCHGPYFLRSIIELETDAGITGIGETYGNQKTLRELEQSAELVRGKSAFAYRSFAEPLQKFHPGVFAAIEMACLDAVGQATSCRVSELLGGPVREEVEFAAYLFYRYAADDPRVLSDTRLVDSRGKGDKALDPWGEVRTAESMTEMAAGWRKKFGFRVMKLKAGVLEPAEELRTMEMMAERFGPLAPLRIDPNGRWTVPTAISAAGTLEDLNLEYYEDPVAGQIAMADVRTQTGLKLATNSCVSRWRHVRPAVRTQPIDILLGDIYWFGGLTGLLALGQAAESLGWGLSYHSNNHAGITMAAMIHALASTPQFGYAGDTHYVWLPDGADLIEGPNLPIKDGKMSIPKSPGLGVRLDQDKLARAHEAYRKSGMKDRDDASTMRVFEPGWKRALF
jgi:glucarate dehydratase